MQHKSLTVIAARHSIFDIQHVEPGVEGIIFGVTLNNVTPPNIFRHIHEILGYMPKQDRMSTIAFLSTSRRF